MTISMLPQNSAGNSYCHWFMHVTSLLKNTNHQPLSRDDMNRIDNLSQENPEWEEKCKVNNLTLKAVWRKYKTMIEKVKKRYYLIVSLSKTFH